MRIALVHTWDSTADIGDRVWAALCRTWPQADRFVSDIWQSAEPSEWQEAAPRRWQLMGQALPRHSQLLSRLPRGNERNTALLQGYELVVSTSLSAAHQVSVESGTIHACFMGTEVIDQPVQSGGDATDVVLGDRADELSDGLHSTGTPHLRPRFAHHADFVQPPQGSGVTHYLATTHAAAAQYHFDLDGRPHAVLYPPIDTTFFRPGPESHENYYLLVCHPGVPVDVGLVLEACEAAHRELVILGAVNLRQEFGSRYPRVRWESLPADAELRSRIRRCRALLSVAYTGFDPALVEAQACGTPVIAYHGAATEEAVLDAERTGLGTGLFFHTLTARSLVSAMHELERRPQNVSAVLSLAQAEKFSPAHFEHGLLNHLSRWTSSQANRQKAVTATQSAMPAVEISMVRRRAA